MPHFDIAPGNYGVPREGVGAADGQASGATLGQAGRATDAARTAQGVMNDAVIKVDRHGSHRGCQINDVFGNCSPVLGLVKAYKVARLLALEHEETSDGIFIINQGANLTFEEIVNDTNS